MNEPKTIENYRDVLAELVKQMRDLYYKHELTFEEVMEKVEETVLIDHTVDTDEPGGDFTGAGDLDDNIINGR